MPVHTPTPPRTAVPARRRKRCRKHPIFTCAVIVLAVTALGFGLARVWPQSNGTDLGNITVPDWVEQDIIRMGRPSRDGTKLTAFNDVVVHYVGNPGTTAKQNRNWFDNPESSVSAHFVIGLEGEIIQCLPLDEQSAASNHRNGDTVSIEVCHPDESGKFTDATYQSLVRLVSWLLDAGNLSDDRVIRHYDITGKECPRYFVRSPEAWQTFLGDVALYRRQTA